MTDVTIRAETEDDRKAVRDVVAEAFVDEPVVADLVDRLRDSSGWRPGLSLVAEREGAAVGYVLATRAWLDAPDALVDVLLLSPLAVHPDHQRGGIGGALVRALLDLARARDEPGIFLEGSTVYYSRFGFSAAGDSGVRRPSLRIPPPAFQVVWLPSYDENRHTGTLAYPDAFWELDCVGLR